MSQLYVMVPGNPQPQLMTLDEAAAQIRAGTLPDSADVVRIGEATWVKARDLPELAERLRAPPPPPPTAPIAQFAPPLQTGAGQPATLLGSQAAQPSPYAGARPSPLARLTALSGRISKGALIGGGAGLGLLVLGGIALAVYRNTYSHGLVFDHLPDDCGQLVYVDVEGIAASEPVKPNLEKGFKNAKDVAEDQIKSHKEKDRLEEALDALKKNGVDASTVREVAFCIRQGDDKKAGKLEENGLVVLGGTFRKGDPLRAIQETLEAATGREDQCKIEDDDLRLLKCSVDIGSKREPFYVAMLEGRVLAVSFDKRAVKSVRASKNVAKVYGVTKGEHFVYHQAKEAMGWDGTWGDVKVKIGATDTVLAIEQYYDADKGKAKLAELKDPDAFVKKKQEAFKQAAKICFAGSDFDPLADSVDNAKVEAYEDGIKYELRAANKDLSKLMKSLSEADTKDVDALERLGSCIGRTVESTTAAYPPPTGYDDK
ncbi:MAG: hypothetical protein NVSMB47_00590 [Polyangiales bacterium]